MFPFRYLKNTMYRMCSLEMQITNYKFYLLYDPLRGLRATVQLHQLHIKNIYIIHKRINTYTYT